MLRDEKDDRAGDAGEHHDTSDEPQRLLPPGSAPPGAGSDVPCRRTSGSRLLHLLQSPLRIPVVRRNVEDAPERRCGCVDLVVFEGNLPFGDELVDLLVPFKPVVRLLDDSRGIGLRRLDTQHILQDLPRLAEFSPVEERGPLPEENGHLLRLFDFFPALVAQVPPARIRGGKLKKFLRPRKRFAVSPLLHEIARFPQERLPFGGSPDGELFRLDDLGLDPLQLLDHRLDGRVPFVRVLLQRLAYDLLEVSREAGLRLRQERRIIGHDRIQDSRLVFTLERELPRQHLKQEDRERPDIRPLIEVKPPNLLGRHERERSHPRAHARDLRTPRKLGKPEIDDLHLAVGSDDDVCRLDVAVDDPVIVRFGKPAADPYHDIKRFGDGERPARDLRIQVLSAVERHADEEEPLGRFADLVDRADVRVVKRGRRLSLLQEALLCGGVPHKIGHEKFQGDDPLQGHVLRPVHDPHPPAPDPVEDLEMRDHRSNDVPRKDTAHE